MDLEASPPPVKPDSKAASVASCSGSKPVVEASSSRILPELLQTPSGVTRGQADVVMQ